jgi:hypothetical protein
MNIIVRAEKDGQVVAQSEFKMRKEVKREQNLLRRTRKALSHFLDEHPEVDLFETGVSIRFQRME